LTASTAQGPDPLRGSPQTEAACDTLHQIIGGLLASQPVFARAIGQHKIIEIDETFDDPAGAVVMKVA
jgi:hypothetical protein